MQADSLPSEPAGKPKNTWVCGISLLQGIFPTQEMNRGLLHCRWILYQLSHKGSPRILEWVAYPFSRVSSQPRNQTEVSCIAGGSWPTELWGNMIWYKCAFNFFFPLRHFIFIFVLSLEKESQEFLSCVFILLLHGPWCQLKLSVQWNHTDR